MTRRVAVASRRGWRVVACGLALLSSLAARAPAAPAPAAEFTVSGRFLYEDKTWSYDGWTGGRPELPVRGADVTVLDAANGKLLGRGRSGDDGTFTVGCTCVAASVDVEVRVDSRASPGAIDHPFRSIAVLDAEGATYAAFSPVFPAHDSATDLDVGTTTALAVALPDGDGNPFNIFDLAVAAEQYLARPEIGAEPRERGLRLHWPSVTGSWASGRHAWISGDDGFDDAVILHEIGHVVHNLWSDSDSPGGTHWFGDSDQDPRLAFAEGYATFFGASVMESLGQPGLYVDCAGDKAFGGVQLRLDLESVAPYAASTAGACDEIAVACTLYDIVDDEQSADGSPGLDDDGFVSGTLVDSLGREGAWWRIFSGPLRHASPLTMDDVWDAWLSGYGSSGDVDQLHALFDASALRFWNDGSEPDDTPAEARPIAALPNAAWSAEHTLYSSLDPVQHDGTGDRDWFSVELVAGQAVRIETRYPDGAVDARTQADPFLALYDPAGTRRASDENSGSGRNACIDGFVVPESGTWTFVVRSRNALHRYGRYDVRAVLLALP